MSNGINATDATTGSNKRVRHADAATVYTTTPRAKPREDRPPKLVTPLELANKTVDQSIASLLFNLRNPVRIHAKRTILKYATWLRATEKYDREANDPSFIPTDCKMKFQLQPSARVEATQEFKELAEETQRIVVECREKLAKQHFKCTSMNVNQQKTDITESFAMSIPKIAELLYAEENIQGVSPHTAAANLARHSRDSAISFLNVTDEAFKDAYLKANNLNAFPTSSNPPIITAPAAAGLQHMRGGNDDQANNNHEGRTPAASSGLRYGGSELNVNLAASAIPPHGRGRGNLNAQSVTPNNLGFQAADEVLRQRQQQQLLLQQGANLFDYEDYSEVNVNQNQDNSMAALQQSSQLSEQQQQQQQLQGQALALPPVHNDVNLGQDTAGNNNNEYNTADDNVMGDAAEDQGVNGNNNGSGGDTNNNNANVPPGGQQQAQTANEATAPPAVQDASTTVKMNNVHNRLLDIIEQAFINPRNKYDQQKKANDTDARIKKVAKRQETQESADNVAEAIATQPVIDPSILKIVIKDAMDERDSKKEEESKKKKQQQKNSSAKNNNGGPNDRGAPRKQKKKSPVPKSSTPSDTGAAASSNATSGGSKQGGTSSGSRKSSQKRGTSTTKRSKSRRASKKK